MELRELIRDTLREKMEEQFKTLTAFSKASGVSQGYLSKIFGDTAVDISPTILNKLLNPLKISLSQFFEEVEKKKTQLNIQLSEEEFRELLNMLPNGDEKRGFLARLRAMIPEPADRGRDDRRDAPSVFFEIKRGAIGSPLL